MKEMRQILLLILLMKQMTMLLLLERDENKTNISVGFGKLTCRRYKETLHLDEMNKTYEQKSR
jgi:hypothetical protein